MSLGMFGFLASTTAQRERGVRPRGSAGANQRGWTGQDADWVRARFLPAWQRVTRPPGVRSGGHHPPLQPGLSPAVWPQALGAVCGTKHLSTNISAGRNSLRRSGPKSAPRRKHGVDLGQVPTVRVDICRAGLATNGSGLLNQWGSTDSTVGPTALCFTAKPLHSTAQRRDSARWGTGIKAQTTPKALHKHREPTQSHTKRSSISRPYFRHNRRNSSWNDSRW